MFSLQKSQSSHGNWQCKQSPSFHADGSHEGRKQEEKKNGKRKRRERQMKTCLRSLPCTCHSQLVACLCMDSPSCKDGKTAEINRKRQTPQVSNKRAEKKATVWHNRNRCCTAQLQHDDHEFHPHLAELAVAAQCSFSIIRLSLPVPSPSIFAVCFRFRAHGDRANCCEKQRQTDPRTSRHCPQVQASVHSKHGEEKASKDSARKLDLRFYSAVLTAAY